MASTRSHTLAKVLYNYSATSSTELTITKGQTIRVYEKFKKGWWTGEDESGKVGLFPGSYVRELADRASTVIPKATQARPRPRSEMPHATTGVEFCKATVDHVAKHSKQLSFQAGDVITLLEKHGTGWWKGELNGAVGLFPSTAVALIGSGDVAAGGDGLEEAPTASASPIAAASPARRRPVIGRAKVKFDYSGITSTELSVQKGDVVNILKKVQESGWWQAELNGKIGHVPSKYVEELEADADQPLEVEVAAPASQEAGAGVEKAIVMYDFTAVEATELPLKKGDVVTIIHRGEPGAWWKGECEGRAGHFPGQYVKLMTGEAEEQAEEQEVVVEQEAAATTEPDVAAAAEEEVAEATSEAAKSEASAESTPKKKRSKGKNKGDKEKEASGSEKAGDKAKEEEKKVRDVKKSKKGKKKSKKDDAAKKAEEAAAAIKKASEAAKRAEAAQKRAAAAKKMADKHKSASPAKAKEKAASKEKEKATRSMAVAKYDYTAEGPTEISFKAGDVVTVLGEKDGGWWSGRCNGATGFFPGSYVRVRQLVRALHKFEGVGDKELTVAKGDVLTLKKDVGQGWYACELDGRTGLVPAQYVTAVEPEEEEGEEAAAAPEPQNQPKAEPKAEAKTKAETEPMAESKAEEARTEPEVDTQPKADAEVAAERATKEKKAQEEEVKQQVAEPEAADRSVAQAQEQPAASGSAPAASSAASLPEGAVMIDAATLAQLLEGQKRLEAAVQGQQATIGKLTEEVQRLGTLNHKQAEMADVHIERIRSLEKLVQGGETYPSGKRISSQPAESSDIASLCSQLRTESRQRQDLELLTRKLESEMELLSRNMDRLNRELDDHSTKEQIGKQRLKRTGRDLTS